MHGKHQKHKQATPEQQAQIAKFQRKQVCNVAFELFKNRVYEMQKEEDAIHRCFVSAERFLAYSEKYAREA